MFPLLGFAIALVVTLAMIPLLIKSAPILGLLDEPGERKVHTIAVPRVGGLAIASGFFVVSLLWTPMDRQILSLMIASLVIVVSGLHDDRFNLSYKWKFLGQVCAVLILMWGGILFERLPFSDIHTAHPWIAYPLTFLFLLGSVNAVNLSDGLDGLAAGTMLLSLCLVAVFGYQSGQSTVVFLAMAVAGALAGFLRYNTHPAQVFMGDTGSQFIGLITASLAIMVTQSEYIAVSPMIPLLILGLPILDTLMVMVIRIHSRRSPFIADSSHIHHQFIRLGMRHYEAVAVIYALQIILIVMAFSLRYQPDWLIALSYAAYALAILGGLLYADTHGLALRKGAQSAMPERRNLLLRRFKWYYYYSTQVLQFLLAAFFLQVFVFVEGVTTAEATLILWISGCLAVITVLFQGAGRVTSRIVGYMSSIAAVYIMAVASVAEYSHWYIDAYLMLIVVALVLAIRMTRKTEFRLDTRDMLVLFLVVVLPQLPIGAISKVSLGWFTLRLTVLLYTCELLLSKKNFNYWYFNASAVLGIFLIGWFG